MAASGGQAISPSFIHQWGQGEGHKQGSRCGFKGLGEPETPYHWTPTPSPGEEVRKDLRCLPAGSEEVKGQGAEPTPYLGAIEPGGSMEVGVSSTPYYTLQYVGGI